MIILQVSMEIEAGNGLSTFVSSFPSEAFTDRRFVQGTAGINRKLGFLLHSHSVGLAWAHCTVPLLQMELASCTGNGEDPFP